MKHLYPSKLILKIALGLLFILCSLSIVNAQDNSVAIGSESVKPSAVLYLQGDGTQGMIIPIVTDLGNISTPESGMIVFNSGDNIVYYHDGSSWKPTGGSGTGTDTDDQELNITGNTLAITDGNSINLAGTAPTSSGQVFVWDGSQWTVSSATAPSNGQVLQWNGTTWEPATISGSGTAYTAGSGINIDGSNVISNTGDEDSTDDIISSLQVVGGNLVITEGTSTVQVPISDIEAALTNIDNDASDDITTATTIGGDLSGSMPNPTVAQIQGTPVSTTAPADQQVLKFNQTSGNWEPASDAGGVSYSAGNGITIDGSNSIAADAGTGANQLVQLDGSGALPAVDGSNLTGITASTTVTTDGATIVGDGSSGSPITANTGTGANQLVRLDGSGALPAVDGSNLTGISAGATVTTDGTTITGDGSGGSPVTANTGTGANQLVQLNGSSALPAVDGSNLTNVDATTLQGNAVAGTALAGGDAGLVLKWNGTQWVASADDTGSGSAPTLSDGQLMIGDGATNSAGTVTGDLSLSGNTFTIGANTINSGKVADGTITGTDIAASTITNSNIADVAPGKITAGGASPGQTLEWNGSAWVPVTPTVGGASDLSGLTDANVTSPAGGQALIFNNGTSQFENKAIGGDATLSVTGALTLSNSGVSAGTYPKVTVDAKGRVTNGSALVATDIPNLTLSKITDAGTIAGLSTIGSTNITDGTIQAVDLNAMGASSGQILKWNGSAWVPSADDIGASTDDQLLGYNPATNILDIETGNTVDLSDLQQTLGVAPSGTTRSISISGGNSINVDVADNDNDAANELQTISPSGSDIILSNGGGTVSINDADFDPLNEINSGVAINGNNIEVTDAGGTISGAITPVAPSSGQVLKWNGSQWVAAADDTGSGSLPTLTSAQIVTNDGATNIAATVGGDLTMDNTGAFTVAGLQGNTVVAGSPSSGQVLKFDGTNWIAGADDTGSGSLPTLTNAQVVTNDGAANIAVAVSGDVSFSNTGVVTISPDAVTTAKIIDGAVTDAKISGVDNSKVTGLGALALLGSVSSAQIADGSIASIDIGNGAVTNAKIGDVAPSKITQGGATSGQVLKWDGANWTPQNESGGASLPTLTNAQIITNDGSSDLAVTVSGDVTFANDGTITIASNAVTTAKIANGAVTDAKIASVSNAKVTGLGALALLGSVGSVEITDGSVAAADLNQMGASPSQVLQWNGTAWVPSTIAIPANQDLSLTTNTLSLTGSAATVDLSGYLDNTDAQNATAVPVTASGNLTSTNTQAALQELQTDIDGLGGDTDPANELQDLSLTTNTLSLSGSAATVDLTGYLDNTDAQNAAAVPVTASGNLTSTNAQAALQELQTDIDGLGGDTDPANELQDLSLATNTLSLSGSAATVDLTGYLDNTDAQNAAAVPVTATGNLTSTNTQTALEELQTDIDGISSSAVNSLTDLTDATVGDAAGGKILVGQGTEYVDIAYGGDVIFDAGYQNLINTTAGNNIAAAINNASTTTEIDVAKLADQGGTTSILGSSSAGDVQWVTGAANQILGTNASGDLNFFATSAFFNGTGTPNRTAKWDAAGTGFSDGSILDDGSAITINPGVTLQFGTSPAVSNIINLATGVDLVAATASDVALVTEQAISQALIDNIGLSNLVDGYVPFSLSGVMGESPLWTDGTNMGINTVSPISQLQVGTNYHIFQGTGYNAFSYNITEQAGNFEYTNADAGSVITLQPEQIGFFTFPTGAAASTGSFSNRMNMTATGLAINKDGPDQSAVLHVESSLGAESRGFLMPRLGTTDRDLIVNPANGLMIYNTDDGYFNFYDGAAWQSMASAGVGAGNGLNIDGGTGDVYLGGGLSQATNIDLNGFDLSINSPAGPSGDIAFNLLGGTSFFDINNGGAEPAFRIGNDGKIGIGTSSIVQELTVNGSISVPVSGGNGYFLGTRLALFNDGATTFLNNTTASPVGISQAGVPRLVVNSTGNIDVANNLTTGGAVTSDGGFFTGGASLFRLDATGDPYVIKGVDYSWPSTQGGSGTIFSNDGTGNLSWADPASLGIATSLQGAYNGGDIIEASSPRIYIKSSQTTSGAIAEINLGKDDGGGSFSKLGGIAIPGSSDNFRVTATNNLVFNTAVSDRMTLTTAGNLGVGVLNPRNRLDVEGAAVIGSAYSGTNTAPAEGLLVEGRVGLGITSPASRLHISGTSNDGDIRLDDTIPFIFLNSTSGSNAGLQFLNAGANRMEAYFGGASDTFIMNHIASSGNDITIQPTGNIGLGVTSAVNKLDVEGAVAIGASYSGTTGAPANGLIVEGNVGIGEDSPPNKLAVKTGISPNGVSFSSSFPISLETNGTAYYGAKGSSWAGYTFNDETFAGYAGMYYNHSGNYINFKAGGVDSRVIITSSGNVGIGAGTSPVNKLDVEGAVAIGSSYSGTTTAPTNGLIIEGEVGIGTNNPGAALHILQNGSAIGDGIRITGTDGTNDWYAYMDADNNFTLRDDGSDVMEIENGTLETSLYGQLGVGVNPTVVNGGTGLQHDAGLTVQNSVSAAYQIKMFDADGTDSWYFGISSSAGGNMLIGYNGVFRGQFNSSTGAYSTSSDIRLKKDIENISSVLPDLMEMRVKRYHFKTQSDEQEKSIGFIAQDVQRYFPSLVSMNEDSGFLTLDYSAFGPIAIKAIQEQQEKIESQASEIEKLKNEIINLKSEASLNTDSDANTKSELEKLKSEMAEIKALLGLKAEK